MTKALYARVRNDMARPHVFAEERIGFLEARLGNVSNGDRIVLFAGYSPVTDDGYVDDPMCGGRINSDAIRAAMQRILDGKIGLFHVHLHAFLGRPELSRTDRNEIPRLIESFSNTDSTQPHGICLLSLDVCRLWVWLPQSSEPKEPDKTTIVGFPLEVDFPVGLT